MLTWMWKKKALRSYILSSVEIKIAINWTPDT